MTGREGSKPVPVAEILPCPFCGSGDLVKQMTLVGGLWSVGCRACGARGPMLPNGGPLSTGAWDTIHPENKGWNTRATPATATPCESKHAVVESIVTVVAQRVEDGLRAVHSWPVTYDTGPDQQASQMLRQIVREEINRRLAALCAAAPGGAEGTRIEGWVPNWNLPPSPHREESEYAEFYFAKPVGGPDYERWTPATLIIHASASKPSGAPDCPLCSTKTERGVLDGRPDKPEVWSCPKCGWDSWRNDGGAPEPEYADVVDEIIVALKGEIGLTNTNRERVREAMATHGGAPDERERERLAKMCDGLAAELYLRDSFSTIELRRQADAATDWRTIAKILRGTP